MTIEKPSIKPNILVVDDVEINLLLIEAILNDFDVNLIMAKSGMEAVSKVENKEIALALVDIHMPTMNGIELAMKLRSDKTRGEIPILFITAFNTNDVTELNNYYEAGAVGVIQKPFQKNVLTNMVNIFLELDRQKQQVKEQESELQNTTNELKDSLSQLHQLTKHSEKVREEERLAISRELHDDLGQALAAIKIDLGIIRKKVPDKEVEQRIIKTSTLVSDIISTVQKITSQLSPKIIDDLGLEAGINWYTNEFSEKTEIEIILDLDLDPHFVIPAYASMVVFRIMQESLTNVARHAKASQVTIQLTTDEKNITLSIRDNGIGISENQVQLNTSFGIKGMKERARFIRGTLDVYNHGKGTCTKLVFPIIEIIAKPTNI